MILKDQAKIKQILEGNNEAEGSPFYIDESEDKRVVYLYNKGCLFPSFHHGEVLTIHVSAPKQHRGKTAIIAAKEVISWALEYYRLRAVLTRVDQTKKHWNRYAVMCGMKKYKTASGYNYYEVVK